MPPAIRWLIEPSPPSGGVEMVYRFAETLHRAGYDSKIATKIPHDTHFTHAAPLVHYGDEGLSLSAGDVLVCPEPYAQQIRAGVAAGARVWVLNQSPHLMLQGMDDARCFGDLGVERILVTSDYVRKICTFIGETAPLHSVPCVINGALHRPAGIKKRVVTYMPTKAPELAALILGLFWRRYPALAGSVEWRPLKGLPLAEVARELGEAQWFLSFSHRDSLGMPPLEAMSAGCLVAGFLGIGGWEYGTPENGFWAADENMTECVEKLAQAITLVDTAPKRAEAMRAAGAATAARYDKASQDRALLALARDTLGPIVG
ncbi:MAG: hypothetical protein K9H25_14005 [Rhodospirillum sp.]|nr:hypothetical protein [Rhodospirillum sp.]MCF8490140.1 hypothetical protein [Rhodospirillum sp.]MCF8502217.1 hypothetical protein [Rhodospirillum sp.]